MSELPHNLGAQFEARFDGRCKGGCESAVYAGDLMGWVDDEAVCDPCYQEAGVENNRALRDQLEAQRQAERALDPEKFDKRQAAVKAWTDSVKARAAQEGNPEWVPVPGGNTPGWVRNPDHEPPNEQDETVTEIEPGIQALMAAGLLQGQEPGGGGVCHATIETAGIVTEVDIPVPVDPPTAKARAPRKSRAKAAAPSADSAEGPAVALAAGIEADKAEDARLMREIEDGAKVRMAQLEANAAAFNVQDLLPKCGPPCELLANHNGPCHPPAPVIPTPSPPVDNALQAGLQAAVDNGSMTPEVAASLGWVAPVGTTMTVAGIEFTKHSDIPASPWVDPVPDYHSTQAAQPAAATPRTQEPLAEFTADPSSTAAALFLDALSAARSMAEEDAILAALDSLPPYEGGATHEDQKRELLAVIEGAIANHPRSQQKTIGPSEIGTECDHCLAAKLAEWDQVRDAAWLPTVGTAVHSWIESALMAADGGRGRYLTERRVLVGTIDGMEVTGSTDLVDTVAGWTWDWKIVGVTTLRSAKTGPSRRYVVQQMLYARGWNMMGVKVTRVGIAYLPRNSVTLRDAVFWSADYDESIAVEALERADAMARNLRAMASISTETRDQYITGLPRYRSWKTEVDGVEQLVYGNAQEGKIECLDCPRYSDYPEDPKAALASLAGLL